MSSEDRELVEIVGDDLAFLRDDWDQDVTDASLRRSSVVVRRLLVDGHIGRVWRCLGFEREPSLVAPNLAAVLEGVPPAAVTYAQAGGALHRGLMMAYVVELGFAMSPQQHQVLTRRMEANQEYLYSLSEFLKSICVVIGGTPISRGEVVKYVSNKLGGAHFDASRKEGNTLESKFKMLDSARSTYRVSETNTVLFELLSVGQALIQSKDIQNLLYVTGRGPTPR